MDLIKRLRSMDSRSLVVGAIVLLGILLLLVWTFVSLLRISEDNDNKNETEFIVLPENENIQTQTFSDTKTIGIGDKIINLPENWSVTQSFTLNDESNYECIETCTVYEISNSVIEFTLVIQGRYFYNNEVTVDLEKESVRFLGEDVEVSYEPFEIVNIEDSATEPAVKIYRQAFVCNSESTCLSTGLLNLGEELNKNQIASFKELVGILAN